MKPLTPKEYLEYFDRTYKEKLTVNPLFADRYIGFRKIFEELLKKKNSDFSIIETGALRKENSWTDGQSSLLYFEFLSIFGGKLTVIDIDGSALALCEKILTQRIGEGKAELTLIHGNSIEELNKLEGAFDLAYLDSFDFETNNPLPSMTHHLKELVSLRKIINRSDDLLIAVDDNFDNFGKGKFVSDWAKETKKEIVHDGYQFIFRMG